LRLHLNKGGIRALGVAESFRQEEKWSVIAGVVMRGDLIVDGAAYDRSSVGGDDATRSIARLFRRLKRNDVNVIMVSGAILSLYNIIDVDGLAARTGVPVVCVTYKETAGIEGSIRRRFPGAAEAKLAAYRKLGARVRVRLSSGGVVYVRTAGMGEDEARSVLNTFTLQGSVPEPLKLARILARAVRESSMSGRPTRRELSRPPR